MAVSKAKRLSKIAREFNVGISTIVDFLQKNGVKIDSNPNTKVSPDCYDLLVKEYSSDSNIKKESEKLFQRKGRERKESVSLDDLTSKEKAEAEAEEKETIEDEKGNVILIKDVSGAAKNDNQQQQQKEETEEETEEEEEITSNRKKFKVVGKIDLDSLDAKQQKKQQDKDTETDVQQETEKEKETKPEKEDSTKQELKKEAKEQSEEKKETPQPQEKEKEEEQQHQQQDTPKTTETKEPETKENKEKERKETPQEKEKSTQDDKKPKEKTDIDSQKEETKKTEAKKQPEEDTKKEKQEKKTEEEKKSDKIEEKKQDKEETITQTTETDTEETTVNVETEKKDAELKVVGKINLDALNQKTRPTKKKKKSKDQQQRTKSDANKDKKQRDNQRLSGDNANKRRHNKTEDENRKFKSQDKPTDKKEQPDEELKKTEKKEDIFQTEVEKLSGPTVVGKIELPSTKKSKKKPVASSSDKEKNRKKKRKRIKDKVQVSVSQNKSQKKDGGNKNQAKKQEVKQNKRRNKTQKKSKKPTRKVIDEEDVQKQIRETLARLTKSKSKSAKHRRQKREQIHKKQQEELEQQEKENKTLKVTEFVSVSELANMMSVQPNEVISTCMNLGLLVSINQRLDADTMSLVADEFGYDVEFVSIDIQEAIEEQEEDKDEDLTPRSPIVTVMGHVDHGKTSLLDYIRQSNIIAGEAGGITQHIGAYNVTLNNNKKITFLDTPGHEAFTAMRARGAQVTDVAIIVIAADDSVMPQTVEAINHAQAAGVPIVFAINKIDKPGANPDKIKEELANMNYLVEEWGGKYQSEDISAKHGKNIDDLLEKVLLEAELLELKANPNRNAYGTVIEATLDRGRGFITTLLVENGTMKIGDIVLAGRWTGRVKAMYNERNKEIDIAGPSAPVLILGLDGAPQSGDKFNVMDNEREARDIAQKRGQLQREQGLRAQKHITLDEIGRRIAIGNFQELNIIIKGDVVGSIEALADAVIKKSTEEIQLNVIHKAVGQIAESDVMLAAASNAIIIGFQVRPSVGARRLAEKEGIDIRLYSIIYDAINELRDAMEGMLSPIIKEQIIGTAEVLETFKITKVGTIAGCLVKDGKIVRKARVRVIREGIVVYTGDLGSLKRFKDDAKEVSAGFECGLNIDKFNDIKVGDMIEAFKEVEVDRKL